MATFFFLPTQHEIVLHTLFFPTGRSIPDALNTIMSSGTEGWRRKRSNKAGGFNYSWQIYLCLKQRWPKTARAEVGIIKMTHDGKWGWKGARWGAKKKKWWAVGGWTVMRINSWEICHLMAASREKCILCEGILIYLLACGGTRNKRCKESTSTPWPAALLLLVCFGTSLWYFFII